MKVGDLVDYYGNFLAVVLYVNKEGGTVKALRLSGETGWLVKSGCKVVSKLIYTRRYLIFYYPLP